MKGIKNNNTSSVMVPLSNEEYMALERIGEKYYTNRVSTVIKNIVRDEKKDFEANNETGIFVNYMEESKADRKINVNFDGYTNEFVRKYSKKIGVPLFWFVRFLILPQIEKVLQEGNRVQ